MSNRRVVWNCSEKVTYGECGRISQDGSFGVARAGNFAIEKCKSVLDRGDARLLVAVIRPAECGTAACLRTFGTEETLESVLLAALKGGLYSGSRRDALKRAPTGIITATDTLKEKSTD